MARRKLRVYLAGPMRGYKDFNFPAFRKYAKQLRADGFEVFNPAEKGVEAEVEKDPNLQHSLAFRRRVFKMDIDFICEHADVIAMMPGWEMSSGARAEHALALAIGIKVMYL